MNNNGLYIVGLGLGDEKDISIRGFEIVSSCSAVYLESYTSVLGVGREKLEKFYNKTIIDADRDMVEQNAELILESAEVQKTAFLVVGDPFGATTHSDLMIRAKQRNINVEVVHNASILNAVGVTGLQLYSFGQTVSIVFWEENWKPDSFYFKIKQNKDLGFHTLCLLDIKVKEQSLENLVREKKIYEPPRFMTVNQCIAQLLAVEDNYNENVCTKDSLCVGLARVGQPTQLIKSGTMNELITFDFGGPLHSFIVCGKMHPVEEEYFTFFNK